MQNQAPSPRLASQTGGLPSAVKWAQLLLADRLQPGDIALDATTGNGHDTLFLSLCIGPTGHVYGLDLQAAAIAETQRRLTEAGLTSEQFTLIHAGHETMLDHVKPEHQGKVAGIMFNLGYLPGSDKTVITRTETTLAAIQAALTLLKPGGLLTLAVYPGHEGGAQEQAAITAWASALPPRAWEVQHLRPVNRSASPPECWVVWKNPLSLGK
ncbi:Putative rRNA methylase [Prosthecobacter debontii]|uniref:Putative rRNA methylase n=1 Tax=Prosthecobacter debontii TaxID=48467 RepID=A0A1T4YX75_9BACT|nr:class I SAM-dependent methyltransferase [Prosthecobacter debontii]SKB05845.1 Putative rRNA methylase [Prosthecobacter debontii]